MDGFWMGFTYRSSYFGLVGFAFISNPSNPQVIYMIRSNPYKDKSYAALKEEKLKELNEVKRKTKIEWGGFERLKPIITNTLKIKFERAEILLKEAMRSNNEEKKLDMLLMMLRAYDVLTKEAEKQGIRKLESHIRCFDWDGQIWYVTDFDYEIPRARAVHSIDKKAGFISVQELFRSVPKELMDMRLEIALMFEGSQFVRVEKK